MQGMTSPSERALGACLLILVTLAASCAPAAAEGPEIVLTGGRIYATPDGTVVHSAVAIDGDTIAAIGTDAEIRALATDDTQEMPLDGAAVLAGFHDAWIDLLALGAAGDPARVDLHLAASPREVQARLRAVPPGSGVVVGQGWDEHLWADPAAPAAALLDEVVDDRPVVLYRRAGRVAWLNSVALERGNVADSVLGDSGLVTGSALDRAEDALLAADRDVLQERFRAGLRAAADAGLTSLATAPLDASEAEALARLDDADLTVRVQARLHPGVSPPDARDHLSFGAIGLELDGPLPLHLAALSQPYADGVVSDLDATRLENACTEATSRGLPLDVHLRGDAALTAAASCPALGLVVGGDVLPAGPLPEGLRIAAVPGRMGADLYWLDALLGPERAARTHAYRDLAAAGALAGIASAAPANDPRLTRALRLMLTRKDAEGYPLDGWHPAQRLAVPDSLRALYAAAPRGGRLEAGRVADLTVWSEDPFAGESELQRAQAMLVFVGGRVVFSRPLVTPPLDRRQ